MALKFFESKNIKVFPCAYRGNYKKGDYELGFDPEARINSEYNLTHLGLNTNKKSYILSYTEPADLVSNGLLSCIIGGYYFEIACKLSDFLDDSSNILDLYIKPYTQTYIANNVSDPDPADSARTTEVLGNIKEDSPDPALVALDQLDNATQRYYFYGICAATLAEAATAGLLYGLSVTLDGSTINNKSFLPKINAGGVRSAVEIGHHDGTEFIIGKLRYRIRDSQNKSFVVTYNSEFLLQENDFIKLGGLFYTITGTDIQAGMHIISLDKEYTGPVNDSIAIYKIDSGGAYGENALAQGANTLAKNTNAAALGKNTITARDNQTVVGEYNAQSNAALFLVGNGEEGSPSNAFEVQSNKIINNKQTIISNTLTTTGSATFSSTATFNGSASFMSNLAITGELTANKITTNTGKQITFNGNVDAKGGLDVSGAKLTVGNDYFEVDTNGDTKINGILTAGKTNLLSSTNAANEANEFNFISNNFGGTNGNTIKFNYNCVSDENAGGITNYSFYNGKGNLTDIIAKNFNGNLSIQSTIAGQLITDVFEVNAGGETIKPVAKQAAKLKVLSITAAAQLFDNGVWTDLAKDSFFFTIAESPETIASNGVIIRGLTIPLYAKGYWLNSGGSTGDVVVTFITVSGYTQSWFWNNSGQGGWIVAPAYSALYAGLDTTKGTIEQRLTNLGFKSGNATNLSNISSVTLKKLGKFVICKFSYASANFSFKLPEGYRPYETVTVAAPCRYYNSSSRVWVYDIMTVYIYPNGTVNTTGTLGNNAQLYQMQLGWSIDSNFSV